MDQKNTDIVLTSWRRFFRRTNVHIAEYIIMLVLVGSLAGVLVSSVYSFFGMVHASGFLDSILSIAIVAQLGSLLVLAPVTFWLYARVSGQEMVQPELTKKSARTVFLTIWLIGMFLALIGVAISVPVGILGAIVGGADSAGSILLTVAIPGVIAGALLSYFIFVISHRSTRRFAKITGLVLASLTTLVLIANLTVVLVNIQNTRSNNSRECTYSKYSSGVCTYDEYRESVDSYGGYGHSGSGGFENIYQPSYRF